MALRAKIQAMRNYLAAKQSQGGPRNGGAVITSRGGSNWPRVGYSGSSVRPHSTQWTPQPVANRSWVRTPAASSASVATALPPYSKPSRTTSANKVWRRADNSTDQPPRPAVVAATATKAWKRPVSDSHCAAVMQNY